MRVLMAEQSGLKNRGHTVADMEERRAAAEAFTVGAHLHDVRGAEEDHRAPGEGDVDFAALAPLLGRPGLIRVLEPAPDVPPDALRRAIARLGP